MKLAFILLKKKFIKICYIILNLTPLHHFIDKMVYNDLNQNLYIVLTNIIYVNFITIIFTLLYYV